MPDPQDYLRLNTTAPVKLPGAGTVDLFFDKSAGRVRLRDDSGTVSDTDGQDLSPYALTADLGTAAFVDEETTATLLEKLMGAEADPVKIGTEFMPDVLEVDTIKLFDTSADTLDAGSVGLNASNQLVVHDGARAGGKLVSNYRRFQGSTLVGTVTIAAADYGAILATIPLLAAETAVNSTFLLRGRICAVHDGGTGCAMVFGLQTAEGYALNGFYPGAAIGYEKADATLVASVDMNMTTNNAAGVFYLFTPSLIIETKAASTVVATASSGYADAMTPGAQNLYILLLIPQTASVSPLTVTWDLELVVTPG